MALLDGKLDAMDLMAIEYQEKEDKIRQVVEYVLSQPDESNIDITEFCEEIGFKPSASDIQKIAQEVYYA